MRVAPSLRRQAAAHWALLATCALFLLVGALAFDDYGVWADTWAQHAIGNAALDYLAGDGERAFDQLRVPSDRYYGAVFEAPLVLVERILGLEDGRDVILGRQLLSHLFFLAGGVFCYLLVLRLCNSRTLALIATILFLLHPRIYAHSFFNSKDAPFLVAFMIALSLTHRAFRRDALGAFILCGVGVGLLVNLRVMGVVLFAAVLVLRGLDLAFAKGVEERGRVLLTGGAFALAALLTYYASLPVLWTDPFERFAELLRTFGAHPTAGFNLFRGEWLYSRDGPPFDYVPVWVGITTPPATLLLATIGAVALAWRAIRHPRRVLRNGPLRFGLLLAALPVATVVALVLLDANLYFNWRYLFFLYAPLLLLAVLGLHWPGALLRGRRVRAGAYALAGTAIAVAVVSLVRIHPHQSHYFSLLTDRSTPERLTSRYTVDPWEQSAGSTLAAIVGEHPSGRLFVNNPLDGARFLAPGERERLIVTRDFRSGEPNFLFLPNAEGCPPASARPSAAVYTVRVYAATLWCVVDPVAWLGELRRRALAADPVVRSIYDVWRDGRLLTYVRGGCPRDDVEESGPGLFLHVIPRDAGVLPPWRREHGFENLDRALQRGSARIDGDCVGMAMLPDYPVASIRTGQFTDDGVLWEATVAIGVAAARREALASEPLARSGYDLYVDGRTLTYLRDGCTDAEADARFFLHVVPADEGDLPEQRREHGFANLDFTLAMQGGRLNGNCVAVAPLPDYPIASIRTGQYDDTGALWTVEFALPGGE